MAADAFPDFELIPAEEQDFSPDEELAGLVDADEVADLETDDAVGAEPLGFTWSFNWDEGSFGPAPQRVGHTIESVVMIAQVALRTKRGVHQIFSDEFGMDDPDGMVGQTNQAERRARYKRDVTDTLLACHERIERVGDFQFLNDPDSDIMYVDLTMEIDTGEEVRLEAVPLGA